MVEQYGMANVLRNFYSIDHGHGKKIFIYFSHFGYFFLLPHSWYIYLLLSLDSSIKITEPLVSPCRKKNRIFTRKVPTSRNRPLTFYQVSVNELYFLSVVTIGFKEDMQNMRSSRGLRKFFDTFMSANYGVPIFLNYAVPHIICTQWYFPILFFGPFHWGLPEQHGYDIAVLRPYKQITMRKKHSEIIEEKHFSTKKSKLLSGRSVTGLT